MDQDALRPTRITELVDAAFGMGEPLADRYRERQVFALEGGAPFNDGGTQPCGCSPEFHSARCTR